MNQTLISHQRGSALIMSVALTALMITASLSISVAIAAVARNTSLLAAANQSFFAAEGGIEAGIYKIVTQVNHGAPIDPLSFIPDNGSSSNTAVLNSLAPGESIELALNPQENVALYLYNYDSENNPQNIPLADFTLTLTAASSDLDSIKSDFSLDDREVSSFDDDIGKALVSPTINLRKENGEEWGEDDVCDSSNVLYQQVDSSLWCPICPDWIIAQDENDSCKDLTTSSNISNLETDSYPIAAGTGIGEDPDKVFLTYSVYDNTARFYLDQDNNDLVSAGSTAKFTILSEEDSDTVNYYREISSSLSDYISNGPDDRTFTLGDIPFRKVDALAAPPLSTILTSATTPTLIISNYNLQQTLELTYNGPVGSYLPSPTINITAIGSKGEAAQKITAVMAYRNQVPVFQQSIIY